MITINMDKARLIKQNQIREERKPLLERLDVAFLRAVESGNTALQAEIAAQKQALRDVTADPAIAAAQTVDELKQVWPSILGPNPLR